MVSLALPLLSALLIIALMVFAVIMLVRVIVIIAAAALLFRHLRALAERLIMVMILVIGALRLIV